MRALLRAAVALSALCGAAAASAAPGDPGRDKVVTAIKANHDGSLKRLRDWIKLPTIANMNINHREGAEYMRKLALDAGFQKARVVPTAGVPGVFATLDAGAPKTLAVYFMYDVKHYEPAEWSSRRLKAGWWTAPARARR